MKTARDRLGEAEYARRIAAVKEQQAAERRFASFENLGTYYDTSPNPDECAVYGCDREATHEASAEWEVPKNRNLNNPAWAFSMICEECNAEYEYMENELKGAKS